LNELWSDRLIEIHIANPPKLHFGQKVQHCDLHGLDDVVGDMHAPTRQIKEDIEF
jgi:hypothetical protein